MAATGPEIRTFLCRSDNIGVLIRDPQSGACAAVDVPEAGPVLEALDAAGWTLTDILVTHRHPDHVADIPEVKRRTGAKVTAPRKAGDAVPEVDVWVGEGDVVRIGGLSAEVWETPGHCDDHVSYVFAEAGIAFAGDTLFTLGCGRVLEGSPETLWASLTRFLALPDATRIYSGHDYVLSNARFALAVEPDNTRLAERMTEAEAARSEGRFLIPTTMGAERATNPFLRSDMPAVAQAAGLSPNASAVEVFSALRAWKNRF